MKETSSPTSIKNILKRLVRVFYLFLLLLGLVGTYSVYKFEEPYFISTYSYLVKCDNGKEFDPTSKPINKKGIRSLEIEETYPEILRTFNEDQIKSECEYGTAYFDWGFRSKPKNHKLNITEDKHPVGTKKDQLIGAISFFVGYYIILGIITEIVLYIFMGRVFIPRKIKNICFKTKDVYN